jgi:NitT/TauT family transport system substrate-binding protein
LTVIGILVGACSQQREKVTLGVETGLLSASVWVAENKGYFEDEGLDLTIREFDSGKSSFFAMLEGEGVDISTVAPTPIMFSSFDRQDFYIFTTFAYAYEDIKVIAHRGRGITTAVDLKGKKIGTPIGTTGQFVTELFLLHNGLLFSDVEVIDISPSELPDALNNNRVDAIVIWEPHGYNARNLLGQDAVRLPSSDIYRTTFNFMVMKDFAQAHPGVLSKFLRAIDRATDFVAKHKEESQDIIAQRLKLDKEIMTAIWDDVIMEIFLDQSWIVAIEAEARWAIKNGLTDKTVVPNYLNYIYYDALEEVKPEAIGIIR